MGGIGKTHFVVNYAWTHREVYETICWVNATGKDIAAAVAGLANEPLKLEVSEVLCLGSVYFSSFGSDFAKAR
jgi:hypothetical protein